MWNDAKKRVRAHERVKIGKYIKFFACYNKENIYIHSNHLSLFVVFFPPRILYVRVGSVQFVNKWVFLMLTEFKMC